MKLEIKPEIVLCDCCSIEHQIVIIKDDDKELGKMAYIQIHLNKEHNIFKRIWYAIKYIFGHKCNYGNFDEFIVTKDNIESFKELVKFIEE